MNHKNLNLDADQAHSIKAEALHPKMKIALHPEEKNQIFRLRYNVHIDEFNEPLITASHQYKQIKDELDLTALHIGAFIDNEAVGACRLNFVDKNYFDENDIIELERFDQSVVVASQLLIRSDFRQTGLFSTLLQSLYALALLQEADVALACIPQRLVPSFSRYGFISYKGSVLHPEQGQIVPMYLDLQNEKFMLDIDSPFLKIFEAFKKNYEMGFIN